MIASACIASKLPPSAFGVDSVDVPRVAEEMLDILHEESERQQREALKAKMRGALGRG